MARKGHGWSAERRRTVIPALSFKQPWPWAMFHAGKNLENRNWTPWDGYRGPVWIHASKFVSNGEYARAADLIERVAGVRPPPLVDLPRSAFVGRFDVVDVLDNQSWNCVGDWSLGGEFGRWGWMVADAIEFKAPIPADGAHGLWAPTPEEILALLQAARHV